MISLCVHPPDVRWHLSLSFLRYFTLDPDELVKQTAAITGLDALKSTADNTDFIIQKLITYVLGLLVLIMQRRNEEFVHESSTVFAVV